MGRQGSAALLAIAPKYGPPCAPARSYAAPMRVGVHMSFQTWGYDGIADAQVVAAELHLAEAADRLGFDALWPVEHHFDDYSFCPDNTVLLAHLAARTSRIRLGTGAVILPWNDP